ncbi:alpha/beta hydrolase [Gordonia sp. LSe1-13]|uniref:Alpha/beta hydrolase n=1 Tax=Gordonia sesuvii TaxID=3116777 RepID=A0ABU7MGU4_9ACTN|nr:alpha/beta hydrolase [Gordonia sp. LSe1-13]
MTTTSTTPAGVRTRTVPYADRAAGPLLMDLYLPEAGGRPPVVMWLHGGGWFTGDRTLAPDLATHFAGRGIAMASIDYRLSGDATFPAQLHDVRAAIRFLHSRAGEFGVDPTRIGLWGASAGGHLAALAGVTGHMEQLTGEAVSPTDTGCEIQAVAASYPPVDLVGDRVAPGAALPGTDPHTSPEARLIGGLAAELPDLARAASPHLQVTQAAPAFHISHGTGDVLVPHAHSELLFDCLLAHGIPTELYLLHGYRHGFLNPAGRLDVAMTKVMDDGRLAAEEPVTASLRTSTDPAAPRPSEYGFATIGRFFEQHLLSTPIDSTTADRENP